MIAPDTINAVFEQAVAAGDTAGVVAVAADAHGTTFAAAAGRRSLASDEPITLDTVFRIASMTKLITAVAALQLVERGNLSLDQPLGGLLPSLATPRVLDGFDDRGQPLLRPAVQPVTLRRLLTHTSGFGYDLWDENLFRYQHNFAEPRSDKMGTLDAPLAFEPGERWGYGIGIDWAGQAVEEASGLSLDDYMREHILRPLGMSDTGFVLPPESLPRLAAMHHRQEDGSLTASPVEPPPPPVFHAGGGGLYSTGLDYLRFLRAILGGGTLDGVRILGPAMIGELFRNQIGGLTIVPFHSQNPRLSSHGELLPGMVNRWSLGGLLTTEDIPSARRAGSLSWCGLFNTYYWVDRESGITGAIFTQILPFLDPRVLLLADQFEHAVYEARTAPV